LLPPENASGNWVKVVQRVPVKILLEDYHANPHLLRAGMSATVTIDVR
jgi:membrane fusion protein, multidrug efflux system